MSQITAEMAGHSWPPEPVSCRVEGCTFRPNLRKSDKRSAGMGQATRWLTRKRCEGSNGEGFFFSHFSPKNSGSSDLISKCESSAARN